MKIVFFTKIFIVIVICFFTAKTSKRIFFFHERKIKINKNIASSAYTDQVAEILNQKFFYLSMGHQFFVFESADKKYVIKFLKSFKNDKFSYKILKIFSKKYLEKDNLQNYKFSNFLKNVHLVFENLKDNCALTYLHLSKTNLNKSIVLYDRCFIRHKINLDETFFVVQKKVNPISKFFKNENISLENKKKIIKSFFQLIKNIDDAGYLYDDYHLDNIGLIDNKLVIFDIGSFHINDKKISKYDIIKNGSNRLYKEIINTNLKNYYLEVLDENKK
jgi:hypothetical protein